MVNVSQAWIDQHTETLLPERYVEISYIVAESGLQDEAFASSSNQSNISKLANVLDTANEYSNECWATLENNLWCLNGTRNIYDGSNKNVGYVSNTLGAGSIDIVMNEVHTQAMEGITITWSKEYSEYAVDFTINAYNGSSVVATKTITGNTELRTVVNMDIADYDKIVVRVTQWSHPEHRVRIEQILLGIEMVFDKSNLTKYKHTQTASHISGELPKNSISFSLDDTSQIWNPNNPEGMAKYLSERQQLTVRYGYDVDNNIEWIKGGTFYLSNWNTPSNGIEVSFEARDLLEFGIDKTYAFGYEGDLYYIALQAITQANFPSGVKVVIDDSLKNTYINLENEPDHTIAEVLQMCANASKCCIWQDRDGVLRIEPPDMLLKNYTIDEFVSYKYPEYTFLKELKAVEVNNEYVYPIGKYGETQTLNNSFIADKQGVAKWVAENLESRTKISGSYRADPRIDVLDKVRVRSKYGATNAIILTKIEYQYTGAFKGTYEGYESSFDTIPAGYTGTFYSGEVPDLWTL